MEISNNDLGQFYHTQRPHLRTARCAHAASPTGLSIGYWFSVILCNAISTFISADFLIVFNVLFNFQFKRTRVIVKKLIMVVLLCNTRVSVRLSVPRSPAALRQRRADGLLLSALRTPRTSCRSICCRRERSPANADIASC